jgi:4-hydroxy-tetrahydrodipicolinate synthase
VSTFAFKGTYTALVTPFVDDGERSIDWAAYEALCQAQIDGGVSGLVPCGTTGESPVLDDEESLELVRRAAKVAAAARGRGKDVRVLAGTGSNSTKKTIQSSQKAVKAGADAVMVVVPYYNKPTQAGMLEHYVQVARSVDVPVVVYNIPGRTGIDLAADTLAKIAEACPNVVCTKEATGNVLRAQELAIKLGSRMTVMCGDDGLTVPMMAVGAKGVISVTSNLFPKEVSEVTRLALAGEWDAARKAHLDLVPVHEAMFLEANPGPVKAALAAKKRMTDAVRGPLVRVTDATREKLARVVEAYERR